MGINVVKVKGHCYPKLGVQTFDGRITFPVDDMPDVIEAYGTLYQKVEKPAGYRNPEMYQTRETR